MEKQEINKKVLEKLNELNEIETNKSILLAQLYNSILEKGKREKI